MDKNRLLNNINNDGIKDLSISFQEITIPNLVSPESDKIPFDKSKDNIQFNEINKNNLSEN